jgi:histidine ammonia-lyase
MADSILLTGADMTPAEVAAIAAGARVRLAPDGLGRMRRCRMMLEAAMAEERPIYGVTTGLGSRVTERISPEARRQMSLRTVRGRAHSVGAPMPPELVRAAMAVRANTLLIGAAGAAPEMAELIAACLDAGLTPVVRETGSVGAADLTWGGSLGLGLIGEGEMMAPEGVRPAAEALAAAGLKPYAPRPREGLALVSHSSFAAGLAAIGQVRARRAFDSAQTAAAVSFEGFRGNLSPFDPRALMLRPQPGQLEAAAGIMLRLEGSALHVPGAARRVQDPLSLRCVPQIHGTAAAALMALGEAVTAEINAASDNPAVLGQSGEIISHGGFFTSHLAVTLNALAQALVHLSAAQVARMGKMITNRFTDLPRGLGSGDDQCSGFGPAMKTAEALAAEIVQLAQPVPVYPGGEADGVEDVVAHSAVPAKALLAIVERLHRLIALELMIGAQAVELRRLEAVALVVAATLARVRETVSPLAEDRPLGAEIEEVAARVAAGDFELPRTG